MSKLFHFPQYSGVLFLTLCFFLPASTTVKKENLTEDLWGFFSVNWIKTTSQVVLGYCGCTGTVL